MRIRCTYTTYELLDIPLEMWLPIYGAVETEHRLPTLTYNKDVPALCVLYLGVEYPLIPKGERAKARRVYVYIYV